MNITITFIQTGKQTKYQFVRKFETTCDPESPRTRIDVTLVSGQNQVIETKEDFDLEITE